MTRARQLFILFIAFGFTLPMVGAQDKQEAPTLAPKKDCPLCKLPGRAALFSGATKKACPADCKKLCCKGTPVTFTIKGLSCETCSGKVTAALNLDGVQVESVSHLSNQAVLKYDSSKVKSSQLISAIGKSGYQVTGQEIRLNVTGMKCETCAGSLSKVLGKVSGVTKVNTVCHKTGAAVVQFDPAKTDRSKLITSLEGTAFAVK